MSMSKQDFIELANIISTHRDAFVDETINCLVSFCRGQNRAFKEGRWRAYIAGECGPSGGAIKPLPKVKLPKPDADGYFDEVQP